MANSCKRRNKARKLARRRYMIQKNEETNAARKKKWEAHWQTELSRSTKKMNDLKAMISRRPNDIRKPEWLNQLESVERKIEILERRFENITMNDGDIKR